MLKTTEQSAVQQCNNNVINTEKENSLFTDSMKCTCQLCPTHAQIQNKNGIFYLVHRVYNVFIQN